MVYIQARNVKARTCLSSLTLFLLLLPLFFSFFFFFFLCVCKTPSAPALISMKVLILLLFPARHSVTPTMATASVPVAADDKKCPVCHELFTDPKLLPCSHLLCRHCLISWLQSKAEANCPLCRCVIVDPEERSDGI